MIISQPKTSFLAVVFDVDHDFEGPRAPKAHLDTVNRNLLDHLGRPRIKERVLRNKDVVGRSTSYVRAKRNDWRKKAQFGKKRLTQKKKPNLAVGDPLSINLAVCWLVFG